LLMGLEMMYPMRYDASVPYRNEQAVILLNEIMHLLERDNPDLIIVGGQSSTVSYEVNHILTLDFFNGILSWERVRIYKVFKII